MSKVVGAILPEFEKTPAERSDGRLRRAMSVIEENEQRYRIANERFEAANRALMGDMTRMLGQITQLRKQLDGLQRQQDLLAKQLVDKEGSGPC